MTMAPTIVKALVMTSRASARQVKLCTTYVATAPSGRLLLGVRDGGRRRAEEEEQEEEEEEDEGAEEDEEEDEDEEEEEEAKE